MSGLGEQLYRHITGGRSPRTEPSTLPQALTVLVGRAGSVSAAARILDVPRRSLRDWIAGTSKPSGERPAFIVRTAVEVERRHRLSAGREKNLRGPDRQRALKISGKQGDRDRTIEIGRYLAPGTLRRVVDAYLRGESLNGLVKVLNAGITDAFYKALFSPAMEAGSSSTSTTPGAAGDDEDEDGGADEGEDFTPYDEYDGADAVDLGSDYDLEVYGVAA